MPRVLYADENEDTATGVQRLLSKAGYLTDVALSADDLRKLLNNQYDLVMIDEMLGKSHATAIAGEIKSCINTIVVMTSIKPHNHREVSSLRHSGIDGFIAKPFTQQELIGYLRKYL
jgi:DNA-binding response OmpR family regulator